MLTLLKILLTFVFKLKRFTVRPAFSNKNSLRNQKINWYKDDLKHMKSRLVMLNYLYKDFLSKHVKVMYQDLKSKNRQGIQNAKKLCNSDYFAGASNKCKVA